MPECRKTFVGLIRDHKPKIGRIVSKAISHGYKGESEDQDGGKDC